MGLPEMVSVSYSYDNYFTIYYNYYYNNLIIADYCYYLQVLYTVLSDLTDHCSDAFSFTYGGIVMLPDEASH